MLIIKISFLKILKLIVLVLSVVLFCSTAKINAQTQSPVGYWQCVDYVQNVEDFVPGQKKSEVDLSSNKLLCYDNGATSIGWAWKNGSILTTHKDSTYSSTYFVKAINGSTYLFYPWLVKLIFGKNIEYYVYQMISNQTIKEFSPIFLSDLPKIDRYPAINKREYLTSVKLNSIPVFNPASRDAFQVDLRGLDLSELDLTGSLANLLYADFDDKTIWPPENLIPNGFDRQRIMELGKDPGLGIRTLHSKGITGHGVGIAIIDKTLLAEHQEYYNRLKLYEETYRAEIQAESDMHGPAVASIAVGKTVGVAPEADLYYIAANTVKYDENLKIQWDFTDYASAIKRIIDINKILPVDRKIRVLSLSVGWVSGRVGYQAINTAVDEAEAEGIFVLYTTIELESGFNFHGLGRLPMSDPNNFESYMPGLFWGVNYYNKGLEVNNRLLIPMDSRTVASPTGKEDYVFYNSGGLSWAVPYLAGVYALATQVDPKVTPERFWDLAMKTGKTIELKHDGKVINFGPIINPPAIIAALEKIVVPAVEDDNNKTGQFLLNTPSPNPFNPSTSISYQIPEKTNVNLTVFNINGQAVNTLVDSVENAGSHSVFWDGKDSSGRQLGSGIYLYRLKAGDFLKTQKMTFLR